jgi:hypothetical protein
MLQVIYRSRLWKSEIVTDTVFNENEEERGNWVNERRFEIHDKKIIYIHMFNS